MNREQKRSWAILVGMSLALIFVIIAAALYRTVTPRDTEKACSQFFT